MSDDAHAARGSIHSLRQCLALQYRGFALFSLAIFLLVVWPKNVHGLLNDVIDTGYVT